MRMRSCAAGVLLALAASMPALAEREIGGIELPVTMAARDGSELVLNGAGVRSRFFVRVYVGALYLEQPSTDAATILERDQAGRMEMHFLRGGIEQHQINDAWQDGLAANTDSAAHDALAERIEALLATTPASVDEGDVLAFEYVPGEGTRALVNGAPREDIKGHDFFVALLSTWLGANPPGRGLRSGVLGQ
jgi:hypothetical protein